MTTMLPGLILRWTMPFSWAAWSPSPIWTTIPRVVEARGPLGDLLFERGSFQAAIACKIRLAGLITGLCYCLGNGLLGNLAQTPSRRRSSSLVANCLGIMGQILVLDEKRPLLRFAFPGHELPSNPTWLAPQRRLDRADNPEAALDFLRGRRCPGTYGATFRGDGSGVAAAVEAKLARHLIPLVKGQGVADSGSRVSRRLIPMGVLCLARKGDPPRPQSKWPLRQKVDSGSRS
jgi:hypothetical protein